MASNDSNLTNTPQKRPRSEPDYEPDKWELFQAKKAEKKKPAIKQDSISQLLQEFNEFHDYQNDLTQEVDFVDYVAEKSAHFEAEKSADFPAEKTADKSLKVVDTVKYNAARIELLKAEFYAAEYY